MAQKGSHYHGCTPIQQLAGEPLILLSKESAFRQVVERALLRAEMMKAPTYEVAYMGTAIGLAQAGLGLAICPSHVAQTLDCALARFVPMTGPAVMQGVHIATLKEWAATRLNLVVDHRVLQTPMLFEANSHNAYRRLEIVTAIEHAVLWAKDEPFASQPMGDQCYLLSLQVRLPIQFASDQTIHESMRTVSASNPPTNPRTNHVEITRRPASPQRHFPDSGRWRMAESN